MKLELSKNVFSEKSVLKSVYLQQEDFSIQISENEYNYILEIKALKNDIDFDKDSFLKSLQEQQLRETLNCQFGALRESIYQKAFSVIK